MKCFRPSWLAALACLITCVIAGSSVAVGEEITLADYNTLMQRIDDLEGTQVSWNRSSRSVGCGNCCKRKCCGPSGAYVLYENVIAKPHFTRDQAFLFTDNIGSTFTGTDVSFDWDYDYSPRIEFGCLNADRLGARVRYWHFNEAATVVATPGTGDIYAAYGGSDGIDVEFDASGSETVTAVHRIEMDVLDIEAITARGNMFYSWGVRYTRMDQLYRIASDEDDGILGQHSFEGAGLTVALEGHHRITNCLSAFVKVRGSILFGESRFFATDLDDAPNSDEIVRNSDNDMITVGEISMGVDWRQPMGNATFFVTGAVEAQSWLSAGTGSAGLLDDDDGNYQDENNQNADMGFLAVTVGTGLLY